MRNYLRIFHFLFLSVKLEFELDLGLVLGQDQKY